MASPASGTNTTMTILDDTPAQGLQLNAEGAVEDAQDLASPSKGVSRSICPVPYDSTDVCPGPVRHRRLSTSLRHPHTRHASPRICLRLYPSRRRGSTHQAQSETHKLLVCRRNTSFHQRDIRDRPIATHSGGLSSPAEPGGGEEESIFAFAGWQCGC